MDNHFNRYKIEDRSFVAFIKREIHLAAVAATFNETDVGKIDIIVAELTSNLIKHAGYGEVLYRITPGTNAVFEILCIDKGPGIADMAKALRDGVTTTNTMGGGLGALSRLSSVFQMLSIRDWGTVLYSTIVSNENKNWVPPKTGIDLDVRALCVPKVHEEVCGDGYLVVQTPSQIKIFFGDGLGHGVNAKEAVDVAKAFFATCEFKSPVDILRGMHERVRRTRGLVATVAILNKSDNTWDICGIGNIITRVYTGIEYRNYMSYNGTVGLNIPKSMNYTQVPVERNQHLIMCSDGVQTRWNLNAYPSIFKYDSTIVAGTIYKDYNRGTDDTSVLIAKVI